MKIIIIRPGITKPDKELGKSSRKLSGLGRELPGLKRELPELRRAFPKHSLKLSGFKTPQRKKAIITIALLIPLVFLVLLIFSRFAPGLK